MSRIVKTVGRNGRPARLDDLDDDISSGAAALYAGFLLWPIDISGQTTIPVCWLVPGSATEKAWVRSAVESQWGLWSTAAFTGWGDCGPQTPQFGVRIDIQDVRPWSLVGKTEQPISMQLNFTFSDWKGNGSPIIREDGVVSNCQIDREYCITLSMKDILGVQELYGVPRAPGAAFLRPDGALINVEARFDSGALVERHQTSAGGGWTSWWTIGPVVSAEPAIAENKDHRLEIVVRGSNKELSHLWELSPGGAWSGTAPFPGLVATSSPVMERNENGRLEVFVRGADLYLWHVWQTTPNGGWSGWSRLEGSKVQGDPAVVREWNGVLAVFARGQAGEMLVWRQASPNGGWLGVMSLGGEWTSPPTVMLDAFARVNVFARGRDRGIYRSVGYGGWAPRWAASCPARRRWRSTRTGGSRCSPAASTAPSGTPTRRARGAAGSRGGRWAARWRRRRG